MSDLNIIAYYLPQFYPIKENDEWWGKGFTEWNNVVDARPLFKGHYQPRRPADLGYYDLRVPETRIRQAEMAREAGVTAFCYWHYWFGGGRRLLDRVFNEVLESGTPDFPFCLGWANHSWYAKTWKAQSNNKLLIEQTYPGIEDAKEHFDFLLKAFHDDRYVKIDGKPFFLVFDPDNLPAEYIGYFIKWTKEAGYPGLYLVGNIPSDAPKEHYLDMGYSSVIYNRLAKKNSKKGFSMFSDISDDSRLGLFLNKAIWWYKEHIQRRKPTVVDYRERYKLFVTEQEYEEDVIPQIIPQWDHTPRSGIYGQVLANATPKYFYHHSLEALKAVEGKKSPIIVLKSWNEWGEGNYMEPDSKYGYGFIQALRKAVDEVNL